MRTIKIILLLLILPFSMILSAQVGIDTASPTKDLDINGELRIRDLPYNSDPNLTVMTADDEGNVGSKKFTLNDADMLVATSPVLYTLNAGSASVVDNIDLGLSTTITIPAGKKAFIKIYYSVPVAAPTGNNEVDKNGTRYYGVRLLRNNIVEPAGSRMVRATDFENGDNISTVTSIYTETYDNTASSTPATLTFTLNGYVEQVQQNGETLAVDNNFVFNMANGSTDITGSYGIANLNKQVFIIPN